MPKRIGEYGEGGVLYGICSPFPVGFLSVTLVIDQALTAKEIILDRTKVKIFKS